MRPQLRLQRWMLRHWHPPLAPRQRLRGEGLRRRQVFEVAVNRPPTNPEDPGDLGLVRPSLDGIDQMLPQIE